MHRSTDLPSEIVISTLRFVPVRMGLFYGVLTYLYLSCFFFRATFAQGPLKSLVASLVAGAIMLMVYAFLVQRIEERPVKELALRPVAGELGLGLLIGLGLYTLCVLILMALGNYSIDGQRSWIILLAGLATPLSTAVYEELWFRGVVFRLTQEWFGTWVAIVISSLIFGFVHWDAAGATLQGLLSISLWAGLLLCATFVLTGRLWVGIGLHAAWNYTQGAVYSGSVSGNRAPDGFFVSTLQGSEWLTGGSFGMEASVVALLVCSAVGVLMMYKSVQRGLIVQPPWRR